MYLLKLLLHLVYKIMGWVTSLRSIDSQWDMMQPPGDIWQDLTTFFVVQRVDATVTRWVEDAAAKRPRMHKRAPTAKNELIQNVNSAEFKRT